MASEKGAVLIRRSWPAALLMILLVAVGYAAGFATAFIVFGGSDPHVQPELDEQSGSFQTVAGQEGVVHFPRPYRQAPNVELEMGANKTVITECTPISFRWKNAGKDDIYNNAKVNWVARGLK